MVNLVPIGIELFMSNVIVAKGVVMIGLPSGVAFVIVPNSFVPADPKGASVFVSELLILPPD